VPNKDYQTNILNPGLLQLYKQTVLLIDETNLEEGKITEKGLGNIKALA